ncbi:TetR/AcrR family transcriptional regulator [Nocardiopsis aegyptia]|uniref:AcrR family transcriptional regulator n=1 Tax=Nocardiopsis aegyptia TaxID=220378 RepID=A0A7Z0ERP6_9ACTN|nr:TetR/AcrR family transcriptional regulator [Nocardiopsis aegyptia]NYJ37076.1 AcrR family transcriptional regulator [Nocardiopsis aegyptia]
MPKRNTYHHGDLKATLVRTGLGIIAERGVSALSVAEVARRAGVSSGAPYRHFAGRKDLLVACAVSAARQLTGELRRARVLFEQAAGGDPDPVEATAVAAAAYTRFAAEHGSGFDLIFAGELQDAGSEELLEAGRSVMDAMLPAVLTVTDGDAKRALELLERQVAAAHGYASLLRGGFLTRRHATPEDVADHAAVIARTLSRDAQRRAEPPQSG